MAADAGHGDVVRHHLVRGSLARWALRDPRELLCNAECGSVVYGIVYTYFHGTESGKGNVPTDAGGRSSRPCAPLPPPARWRGISFLGACVCRLAVSNACGSVQLHGAANALLCSIMLHRCGDRATCRTP